MKIAIIANHNWPVNTVATPPYTGDFFYALLAKGLDELGHVVSFVAPKGSYQPDHGRLLEMPCAFGKYPPTATECEANAYYTHQEELKNQDIVCDFSTSKFIAETLWSEGYHHVCSNVLGGSWNHPNPRHNIIVQSKTQRERGLKGETDYAGTLIPDLGGPHQTPIPDAKVIYGGINTDYYTPYKEYDAGHYYLWMGRWHPVRGYREAIEIAKRTGIPLMMVGENPKKALMPHQRECALEAMELAKGYDNIKFCWLPADEKHHNIKRGHLRTCKAVLLTTQFQEPFGMSQVEAMSCGAPCLSTNYGSMPEVLGEAGICVENTIEAFIEALPLLDQIDAKVCRQRAVKLFDYKVMTRNYEALFHRILRGETW